MNCINCQHPFETTESYFCGNCEIELDTGEKCLLILKMIDEINKILKLYEPLKS